jgi:hypothetical protein
MELYVWDYVAQRWSDGRGGLDENRFVDNFAGNRDEELAGHIRSEFARYLGPGGQMTLLLYAERPTQESFHDYLSVSVSHEACLGADADFDGWADACDNCPSSATADQANGDGDPRGDACDCAPLDPEAFATPLEIGGLGLASPTTLVWDSEALNSGGGTAYDVLRGTVGVWGPGYGDACLGPASSATLDDPEVPGAGAAWYYLVRGSNVCGTGSWGTDSSGTERGSGVCP